MITDKQNTVFWFENQYGNCICNFLSSILIFGSVSNKATLHVTFDNKTRKSICQLLGCVLLMKTQSLHGNFSSKKFFQSFCSSMSMLVDLNVHPCYAEKVAYQVKISFLDVRKISFEFIFKRRHAMFLGNVHSLWRKIQE